MLYHHLDRGWADHLAYLSDASGRAFITVPSAARTMLDRFHRMAVDAFTHLAADAIEAGQTFETANVLVDKPGLDLSKKLARPTV